MISQVTGRLVKLTEQAATIIVGDAFHFDVLVPDFVRRQLQGMTDDVITLRTMLTLEGNPQQGRMVPRLIGFTSEAEQEFFDMICSVDGVGQKKALRAMTRPVSEVATAIEEQDAKALSALPGIGPAMAERIIAKLRRKMARFALMVAKDLPAESNTQMSVLDETFEALVTLGHSPADARSKIEEATDDGTSFKSTEALLQAIYQQNRKS